MSLLAATLWVCPTPGCGDYYGATGTPDLRTKMNRKLVQDGGAPTFPRSQCPSCRARGETVDRVPVVVHAPVPQAASLDAEVDPA